MQGKGGGAMWLGARLGKNRKNAVLSIINIIEWVQISLQVE